MLYSSLGSTRWPHIEYMAGVRAASPPVTPPTCFRQSTISIIILIEATTLKVRYGPRNRLPEGR